MASKVTSNLSYVSGGAVPVASFSQEKAKSFESHTKSNCNDDQKCLLGEMTI
jgi:hypothetical protein